MKILDPNDPFFAPVWRRWATVLLPALWAPLEFVVFESQSWAVIFALIAFYAFWILIIKGPDQA